MNSPEATPALAVSAGSAGLVDGAAERFVGDLHKLSRQQLAEVAAYCIQLMAKPRHTVIPDDHWMLKHQSPNSGINDSQSQYSAANTPNKAEESQ